MIKRRYTAAVVSFLMLFLTACGTYDEAVQTETTVTTESCTGAKTASAAETVIHTSEKSETAPSVSEVNEMQLTINGTSFTAILEDNPAVTALKELLPLTLDMSELNGNEKYCYLDTSMPSAPEKVGHIQEGDIMLYGSNCIVVFYESFDTKYTYTKIGHIEDTSGLSDALGTGSVSVSFQTEGIKKTAYTIQDVRNLQAFLLAGETEEDLTGKPYDLTGDDCWDVFDLCLMKREVLDNISESYALKI